MIGWIINLWSAADTRTEERHQPPIFLYDDGQPCFEIWCWHAELARWFCMSLVADPRLEAQGVIYIHPDETPDQLRARFERLRHGPN